MIIIKKGGEVANIVLNKYGAIDYEWGIKSASTDFVRHLLISLSKIYLIFYLKGKRYLWFVILIFWHEPVVTIIFIIY